MAGRPSSHRRKQGADAKPRMPQEGALLPAAKATSPRGSGSRSQGGRSKGGSPSSAKPSNTGRSLNPTVNTRNIETQKSTKPTTKGAESSGDGVTRTTVVTGNANSGSKALGKERHTNKQVDKNSQASISAQPEMISKQRVAEIEKETRGQRENPAWFEQRRNRITASVAHKISHSKFVNGKSTEVPQSYLKSVVGQGSNVTTPAMKWGVQNESMAIKKYEKLKSEAIGHQVCVRSCGLFVDPEKHWLAASPDGVVVDKATGDTIGLVEIKCPYKHKNHTINKACEDKTFCLERNKGELQLKKNHPYFTQIQCQLAVAGLEQADLAVYTDRDVAIVPVKSDKKFWKNTENKLEDFYTRAVLPELQKNNPVLANEE
ncbi:uncharacterized protein LOC109911545 [Rhincodon typus]|uniref:uncharacterized protein LOC109911545 n=1 Tax=Rhincodon typus TaxID=259920 RepID=UPI0009A39AB0|nr:uncharacterized protein LOC109911545 [Rhincodon typus]XP_048460725.1 uncharacterized protein LOC109911545 [Rhincodon typus]XP_048460726.1 uncharacterized protein LOC109911545 [Rhincodon typus]